MKNAANSQRNAKIVRAARRLVAHWKRLAGNSDWYHHGYWYPSGSEKQAKSLINAVRIK